MFVSLNLCFNSVVICVLCDCSLCFAWVLTCLVFSCLFNVCFLICCLLRYLYLGFVDYYLFTGVYGWFWFVWGGCLIFVICADGWCVAACFVVSIAVLLWYF